MIGAFTILPSRKISAPRLAHGADRSRACVSRPKAQVSGVRKQGM